MPFFYVDRYYIVLVLPGGDPVALGQAPMSRARSAATVRCAMRAA